MTTHTITTTLHLQINYIHTNRPAETETTEVTCRCRHNATILYIPVGKAKEKLSSLKKR
jgi:hypothetical protein